MKFINKIIPKFRTIRNKTHFHIDSEKMHDPISVWKSVDIKYDDIDMTINIIWKVLNTLYKMNISDLEPFVLYDGNDVESLFQSISKKK